MQSQISYNNSNGKNYYEVVDEIINQEKDPRTINAKLSPLIKDYKAKAIYDSPSSPSRLLALPSPNGNGH